MSNPFRPRRRLRVVRDTPLHPVPDPDDHRRRAPDAPASLTGVVQPPEVVDYAAELPDDLDDITKPDLIALAELAGVPVYGTKQDIADRVRAL